MESDDSISSTNSVSITSDCKFVPRVREKVAVNGVQMSRVLMCMKRSVPSWLSLDIMFRARSNHCCLLVDWGKARFPPRYIEPQGRNVSVLEHETGQTAFSFVKEACYTSIRRLQELQPNSHIQPSRPSFSFAPYQWQGEIHFYPDGVQSIE